MWNKIFYKGVVFQNGIAEFYYGTMTHNNFDFTQYTSHKIIREKKRNYGCEQGNYGPIMASPVCVLLEIIDFLNLKHNDAKRGFLSVN